VAQPLQSCQEEFTTKEKAKPGIVICWHARRAFLGCRIVKQRHESWLHENTSIKAFLTWKVKKKE
jgi:hypothetical protein